jgi:hypothetical protein
MNHLSDNYLKKIFKLIYNHIIGMNSSFDPVDLFEDRNVYEDIFMFIQDQLSHSDSDEVDFIYACFSRNWEMYGSSFPEIYGDVIKPKLEKYEGVRSYTATVNYWEYYHHDTYLPVMLQYMIEEYQIDEDNIETDLIDTWDYDVKIKKIG